MGSVLPGGKLAEELENSKLALLARRNTFSLMNARKRRMLLKMMALRAFIGERKIESLYTWETCVEEEYVKIEAAYRKLMNIPMQWQVVFRKEAIAEMEGLHKKLKSVIRTWEVNFERNFFKPPSVDDKAKKKDWYKCYKKLKVCVENLKASNPPVGLASDWVERSASLQAEASSKFDNTVE